MCVYWHKPEVSFHQGMVQGKTYCAVGSGRYLRSEEVEVCGDVAVDRATGGRVEQSWEKMSKSKHNGVDPEVRCLVCDHGLLPWFEQTVLCRPGHHSAGWS